MAGRTLLPALASMLLALCCAAAHGQSGAGDTKSRDRASGEGASTSGANGACCFFTGECFFVSEAFCESGNGIFHPGLTCGEVACEAFGRCCLPDLRCFDLTEAVCLASGGRFDGSGVCAINTACAIRGGCCLADGTCVNDRTLTECASLGGEWTLYQGFYPENPFMDPVPAACDIIVCTGACCFELGGTCTPNLSADACEAAGGLYQGHGSDCAATPCPQIVQCRVYQRTQSDTKGITEITFDKFDDLGGMRRLKSVRLTIDGEVIARLVILLSPDSPGPDETTVRVEEQLALLPFVPGGIPGGTILVNDTFVWCDNNPGFFLNPGETCEHNNGFGEGFLYFEGTGLDQMAPGGNLPFFVGAGGTFTLQVEGTGRFTITNNLFTLSNPVHRAQGKATVIYDFNLLGACCHPCDGTCTPNLSEEECLATGGQYQGDLSTCSPNPCVPVGACCHPCNGTCTPNLTQQQCTDAGGIWQGACATCSPNPCIPIGACCHPCNGTCTPNLTQSQCTAAGGIWQGACTTCSPNPCVPVGACCHPCNGTCTPNLTQQQCAAAGGIWQGACSTCSPNPCPIVGACCHPCNGTCTPNLTQQQCTAAGGIWQGACSTCSPNPCVPIGACCHPCNGTCTPNLTQQQCAAAGGIWQGACSTCSPNPCPIVGACCHPCNGTCTPNLTQQQCTDAGGIWQSACSTCSPNPCPIIGACCDICSGVCTPNQTQQQCAAAGGIWQGPCSTCGPDQCPPNGACCLPNGDCVLRTLEECQAQGGIFQGACSTCSPNPCTGACCDCDGNCVPNRTKPQCDAIGGIWQGLFVLCQDVNCPPVGACCLPNGDCVEIIEYCCLNQGGDYKGNGVPCNTVQCVPVCRRGCHQKGSLVVWSKVEVRWDSAGNLVQDTFISLTNDYPDNVLVQLFFINGDPPLPQSGSERAHPGWNFVDNLIELTANQPIWWSAVSGAPFGVSPWTVLDPGTPPGRPAMDGTTDRVLRGWIVGWAVNNLGEEIRWNHLQGMGTLVYYPGGAAAWEYLACAFPAVAVEHGLKLPSPGTLNLDGVEYCSPTNMLLLNFQGTGSNAWSTLQDTLVSDTDLTIHPLDADLSVIIPATGPPVTYARIDIWNENEVKLSGTGRCISCWDQTLLSQYDAPNHFRRVALQTDHGKARIDGIASPAVCPGSQDRAILGVYARWLDFNSGADIAAAGGSLHGMGIQFATIKHDAFGAPPPEAPEFRFETPFDAADSLISEILSGHGTSVPVAGTAESR